MARTRTPERILDATLALFNAAGEPNVTTNRIADELDISPGNLHYHFRTRQDLVDALFGRFEQRMLELLSSADPHEPDVEDAWLFLHLVFETIAEYRFLYRDLNDLVTRYDGLERRFRAILKFSMQTADRLLAGLERAGQLDCGSDEREALVRNLVLVASYWIAFDQVLDPDAEPRPDRAAWQVMSLVSPYLEGEARETFGMLAEAYLG
ncbi:MAG: TetR/AcrR family transcriptional regulator [Wenzhouxiangellaceae bacterium]|nr:TetR/AcrR family transcriptional regulator [Wenzhouxiangellaceae bacterium]